MTDENDFSYEDVCRMWDEAAPVRVASWDVDEAFSANIAVGDVTSCEWEFLIDLRPVKP